MSVQKPDKPETPAPVYVPIDRAKSFIGYAFLISLLVHLVTLPFFHLQRANSDKNEVEKVSVTRKIVVKPPTPPPPTPTPPPPTPPPKSTPPPVKQTNPPPQPKLKLNVVKTTSKNNTGPGESKYVPPPKGNENGVPAGTTATGPPAATSAKGPAATAAPTPAPPTPSPKPQCAVPNAPASIKGNPAELDYPDIARQQGAVGTTQVKVTLDASGNVTDATVYKSANNAALDQSAIKAAKATAYIPDIVNCVKTPGSYLFRADFTGE